MKSFILFYLMKPNELSTLLDLKNEHSYQLLKSFEYFFLYKTFFIQLKNSQEYLIQDF
jgi:hypothetical protein